jgi:hypothetical protein
LTNTIESASTSAAGVREPAGVDNAHARTRSLAASEERASSSNDDDVKCDSFSVAPSVRRFKKNHIQRLFLFRPKIKTFSLCVFSGFISFLDSLALFESIRECSRSIALCDAPLERVAKTEFDRR